MKTRFLPLAVLMALSSMIFFVACKKDIKNDDPVTPSENHFAIPAATPVTGSVSGVIVDENNNPVSAAEVKCSGSTFTTDANGLFVIKNVQLDKYVSTVTVNKAGYYKGIRSFSATATMNYLSIKLIPKTLTGTISATAGGPVNLSNGTILTLQSNSVVIKSSGAAYSGTVNVYASYIDPTTSDFSARVPGSMMGQDANSMYVLASTGMMAVELESASGEALQLQSGKPASIKLPIPSSLLTKAPATIDTWSLDDRGVWIKEGTATKNGDFYEMQVSHFSFWNCDFPQNAIYLTIHVQDQNNQPLINTLVELTVPPSVTMWTTTYGYTDSLGNVSGLVPSGTDISMSVIANPYYCPSAVYTQTIGPFAANASITVTATLSSAQTLVITGTANDCNNQPIQDGTAAIFVEPYGGYYVSITNGTYSLTIPFCSVFTTVNVTALDNSTQGYATSGNITVSGSSVTVPLLTACPTGMPATFDVIGCQVAGAYTVGVATNPASDFISVSLNVLTPGTYSINQTLPNGLTFSGSGTFTTLGPQTIQLQASGIPNSAGVSTFTLIFSNGISGCTIQMYISEPQAVFTLGGPGSCVGAVVSGTYQQGVYLSTSNNVLITVNVTTVGAYFISTDSTNGIGFQADGVFTTTGLQTVLLTGYGYPTTAGIQTFTTQANGITGCTFTVDVTAAANGIFTFEGGPGTCMSYNVIGTYTAGVTLNGQNGVALLVNVIATGTYTIGTNVENGMSFSAAGVFTSLGPQTLYLAATGTPANTGTYTYAPDNGSGSGCVFIVTVN